MSPTVMLLAAVPSEHPVRVVVHAAGVLDDGVIGSLTAEQVHTVLGPKVDGAWILHELTRSLDLAAFIMFSSVAGTFGSPGQGIYAAANAFVDALASMRRELGLPALSLAWGPWRGDSGMTSKLSTTDIRRMTRSGMSQLSPEDGMALFDAACATAEPVVLPVHFDLAALRAYGDVPPLLRGLIRVPSRQETPQGSEVSLADRLTALNHAERTEVLLTVVRDEVATVLGHGNPEEVEPDQTFQSVGFDSLTAVELRSRLSAITGLHLPATLVFDYPNPLQLAGFVLSQLVLTEPPVHALILAELENLAQRFTEAKVDADVHAQIAARLEVLKTKWNTLRDDRSDDDFDFDNATDNEVYALLDNELGLSD
jgi:pimaricinolide synthase PimS1